MAKIKILYVLITLHILFPLSVAATILGIQGSTNRQLVSIDPTTGTITNIGSAVSIHSSVSGTDAIDPTNNRFFMIANTSAGSDSQLFILNTQTGALLGSPTLTGTSSSAIQALQYNTTNGVLYGIQGSTNRQLVSIDPTTGTITNIGSAISIHSSVSSTDAIDPTNNRFFMIANTSAGSDSQLFILNTQTGALLGSPTLTGTSSSAIRALQYNTINGVLYGIQGSTNRQLVSIDPTTGTITNIGSAVSIHSSVSGTDAIDPTNNRFFMIANTSAGSDSQLFILNTQTGALLGSPTLTGTSSSAIRALQFDSPPIANNDTATLNEDNSVNIAILSNDKDPEGATLTLVSTSNASNGSIVTNSDNTVTYSPSSNFNGSDQFTYTIRDPLGNTATGTVNLTINPVNDVPIATNDTSIVNEDSSITISILSNDTDVDGNALTLSSVSNASNGSVTSNSNNTVTYTPNNHFNGSDQFTYSISDGNGGTATGTVSLTINPVEDPPVAVADTTALAEDNSITISVLTNDSDPDGNALSISNVATPTNGVATTNNNNTITYTPTANFNGTDQFTYSINDGNGNTATTTVHITVTPTEDPPIAVNDAATLDEDNPIIIEVLKNDIDPDGDAIAILNVSNASNGSVASNNNTITYNPKHNFNGTDQFTYSISDGKGNTATASVNLTIQSINDSPVANNDRATLQQDTQIVISVLNNDSDPEGDAISLNAVSQPTHGSVSIQDDVNINYIPNQGFFGSDAFTYTIIDKWQANATGTVHITVIRNNIAPTAIDDEVRIGIGESINIPVLANDFDTDSDSIWVSSFTQGSHSERVTLNSDGTIHYRPLAEFHGNDQFKYTLIDAFGDTSQAVVIVNILSSLSAIPDSATTDEDVTISIDVLANDTANDSLHLIGVEQPEHGTAQITKDKHVIYIPSQNYHGTDRFAYFISDLQDTLSAYIHITILPINDEPIATTDSISTKAGDVILIDALKNDRDIDGDSLRISEVSDGLNGSVLLNTDGTISYSPKGNFTGEDSFTYLVTDNRGGIATGKVIVTILGLGEGPIGPMALDLNPDFGDQQQRNMTIPPNLTNQIVIDLAAVYGIKGNLGFQAILQYDPDLIRFVGVEGVDLMTNGVVIPPTPSEGIVEINVALFGQTITRDSGSLIRITFDALGGFVGQTEIELISAKYNESLLIGSGGSTVVILGTGSSPSPDFDGDGKVDFQDFIQFASAFGSHNGDTKYDSRFDLDLSNEVEFSDFILFAQAFGKNSASKMTE